MATQGVRPNVATELSIHYFDNHDQRLMQALVTAGALVALADVEERAASATNPGVYIDDLAALHCPNLRRPCATT